MKSERRHELQTNVLADWAGHQIDVVKPHVGLIVTVFLAGLAVLAAWMFYLQWNSSQTTAAWSDFYRAAGSGEAAPLTEMAQRHAGERASVWALLLAADAQLQQGAQRVFTDRKEAENLLTKAIKTYETVLKELREPELRRRTLYSLAEAHEARYATTAAESSDKKTNDLEAARKYYQQVAQEWPKTAFGRAAQRKAEALASPSTQDFLVWFSKQEPLPTETTPGAGGGAGLPFDLSTLPGAQELQLPDEKAASQAAETPTPTTPEAPATGEAPAASSPAPAASSPAPAASEPEPAAIDAAPTAEASPNEPNQSDAAPSQPDPEATNPQEANEEGTELNETNPAEPENGGEPESADASPPQP